jgi:NAD(P)-dependent dehydrogenase (short-subunit alcohol dehydrogenase family)
LIGEVTEVFGRLDILVNDAAYNISILLAISRPDDEVWDW